MIFIEGGGKKARRGERGPAKKSPNLKSYLNIDDAPSDWLKMAFTLLLIGYTSTRERAVRHSDWLYWPFSHVKIKRIDFYK